MLVRVGAALGVLLCLRHIRLPTNYKTDCHVNEIHAGVKTEMYFSVRFVLGDGGKKEVFTRRKYIAFCSNTSKRAAPFSHATRSETMSPNEAATLITLAVFAAMVSEIVHQTCKTKRYVQYSFLSFSLRVEQLCESRGGRPWLSVLMKLTVCVNVKQRCP